MDFDEFIKLTEASFEKFNQAVKCGHLTIHQEDGSCIHIPLEQHILEVFEAQQHVSVMLTT